MAENAYFTILSPLAEGSFGEQLDCLSELTARWLTAHSLTCSDLVQARVYLTDAANTADALTAHPLSLMLRAESAFSWIEQPLLDGTKVALQLWAIKGGAEKRIWEDGIALSSGEDVLLFQSVRFQEGEVSGRDARQQTREAFERHIDRMAEMGMTLERDCHRTWLYVRDIDRHYGGVVKGRNEIFAREGLTADTHFIASTGIGGYGDNAQAILCADFLSLVAGGKDMHIHYLQATDYLNPTAEYGVAFERGTALDFRNCRYRFISGTASIDRNGSCLYRGDVVAQAGRLFLNIGKLLAADGATLQDVRYMIVYLRDVADTAVIRKYMEEHFPHIPNLLTEARVCRPEWLIEVECIATGESKRG